MTHSAIVGEPENEEHPLVLVNDTLRDACGCVCVRLADSGEALVAVDFTVPANGKTIVGRIPQVTAPEMWLIEWWVKGSSNPCYSHYLAGSPPVQLEDYRRWLGLMG